MGKVFGQIIYFIMGQNKSKLKILIIGPSIERSRGGVSAVIKGLRDDYYIRNKYDIDFYDSYIDGGIIVRLAFSLFSFVRFYFTKRHYDIYHINMASRGSIYRKGFYIRSAKRWGKKVITHIHGSEFLEYYFSVRGKRQKQIRRIINLSDMVIALSEEWKYKLETYLNVKNCVVLYNGVDVEKYSQATANPSECKNAFLMLGRIGQRKGSYDLVDAFENAIKSNQELILYMAGDGEVDYFKELVQKRGMSSRIRVIGWINTEEKISVLKKVSTLVLPSYNEGLPIAILEAMAAGKAIISTKVGAIPEVVKKENGILIEPGDVQALTNAILKCSTDVAMLEDMKVENMNKIKSEFNVREMHIMLSKYYDEFKLK